MKIKKKWKRETPTNHLTGFNHCEKKLKKKAGGGSRVENIGYVINPCVRRLIR